jgi:putative methyltransferase (TIGR04325 family)
MKTAKDIVPPIALDIYRSLSRKTGFFGNFRTWDEARKASGGYDSDVILEKVKDALFKVKKGEAIYERDSVLFDKIQYSWPLLAGLLWVASREDNRLNLIDFGGSLGSSYYQNKKFLAHLHVLKWNIIEQKKFVECGKRYFEGEHLKFYYHLDDCLQEQKSNTILLSSVIQYLEKPYQLLKEIIEKRLKYVLFDRTSFLYQGEDRITVQKVPPEIYRASYPAWFFNQKKFLDYFSSDYELIADFESNDRANIPSVFKGYIFKLKR